MTGRRFNVGDLVRRRASVTRNRPEQTGKVVYAGAARFVVSWDGAPFEEELVLMAAAEDLDVIPAQESFLITEDGLTVRFTGNINTRPPGTTHNGKRVVGGFTIARNGNAVTLTYANT